MCNDEFNTYLQSMASTDPLTGVANRRRLAQRAAEEISRARRSNQAVTLAMIDLDHFKNLNDTHGHEAGDRALCAVAATCVEALRGADLVSRTGGEEFVVLMPETTLERGIEVAERLRHAISQIALPVSGGCLTLSASFGVATLRPGETSIDEMLKRADQALYRSKANGRNRVSSQEPAMAARTSLEGGAAAAS
jgi:diguanylate cyclase (GGDEF)-like protein